MARYIETLRGDLEKSRTREDTSASDLSHLQVGPSPPYRHVGSSIVLFESDFFFL